MVKNVNTIQPTQLQDHPRRDGEAISLERLKAVQGGYTPRNRSELGVTVGGASLGILSPDGLVEIIRATVLPLLPLKRKILVYIRKSNEAAESTNANYLYFQTSLAAYLQKAGVPEDIIVVEDEDIGISGVYDSTYRPSLRRVEEMLLRGEIEAIIVVDIARIYRDPTNISPAILADRLKMHRVKIVTLEEMPPKVLDMTRDDDYDYFIEKCREAAKFRKRLRNQTTTARVQAVLQGEWSGSPVPIGWSLVPQHKVRRDDRYDNVAARLCVYQPHAERKLEIMRLGMHPKLTAWDRLWREILRQELIIPPFEPTIWEYMMTRSCLKNCTKHRQDGSRIPYNPNEPVIPTKNMLYNLLLEPLALGYVLYGSGVRAGQKELKALDKKFIEKMGRTHDSQIRDFREFIGINEELAICRTPEDVALFWALHERFSEWEPETSRETNFTSYVHNPKRTSPRAGRPKPEAVANHWVGMLHCLHHGWREDKTTPVLTHTMSYNVGVRKDRGTITPQWFCWRDVRQGIADRCCTIGSDSGQDKLTVVLDAFFLARIKNVLGQFSFTLKSAKGDTPSPEEQKKTLQKEIAAKDKIIKRKEATLESYTDIWAEDEEAQYTPEDIRKKQKEYMAEHITPVEGAKRKLEADLKAIEAMSEDEVSTTANIKVAEQVVNRILENGGWDKLNPNTRQRLLMTFIDYVGVWIDQEPTTDNVVILIQWKHGVQDMLVTWRNPPLDNRPFTAEEDAQLRQLWASDCSVDHLRSVLLPGRRYNLVRRHAQELGVTQLGIADATRSRAWRTEFDQAGKSYAQLHPDTAYLWLADNGWAEINRSGEEIGRGDLPEGMAESIMRRDCLMGCIIQEATSTRDKRPNRRP